MRISVIVPTLNAGAQIEPLLSRLSTQDTKPFEIIVIDSSSEDSTVETAQRCGAKTMVVARSDFDHGRTRNMAANRAGGDILVFMTQDALPSGNTLLGALTAPLEHGVIAAAYGKHIPRDDATPPEVFSREFNYPESPIVKSFDDLAACGIRTFFFSNVCSAVKRDAFFDAGAFPEGVRSNEDMILAAKLILGGKKVAYVPAARVVHSHSYSLFRLFSRYYTIGSSLKSNRWILRYARSEGEGWKFIREEFRFLLARRRYGWIPYVFLEALAKYAGYRIGLITG